MNAKPLYATLLAFFLLAAIAPVGAQDAAAPPEDTEPVGPTPPRLSYIDGEVSFWRPGADDWGTAQINTPLAAGDALYSGAAANLELQIGSRAYVRAGEDTQIGIENQEPDFLQIKVTSGHASLDLRSLTAGHTVEIDTPNAAFTIERTGYYRLDIDDDRTTFITRRGGYATMTPAGGEATGINPSEQAVLSGTGTPQVETYVAPEIDAWDRWNYDRTDHLIEAVSARYLPPDVYGADALDHYGNWRVVESYGPVWVPDGVAAGWVPYSTGRWIWDPSYGWTWIDDAPWGWAPYHYGRWVYANDYWAWAPGPIVVRPVYAPALVAFFGDRQFGVSVGFDTPAIGWVALGWGEPLVPWWGSVGFIGRPCWHGWGGPRVVNNVVINRTTVVNVQNINVYQNADLHHGVVAVRRDHFGRGSLEGGRLAHVDVHHLEPVHGALPIKPEPTSLRPGSGRATRPPADVLNRPVVGTRRPHDVSATLHAQGLKDTRSSNSAEPRLVAPPSRPHSALSAPRAPFGRTDAPERPRPPLPPRFGGPQRTDEQSTGQQRRVPTEATGPSSEMPRQPQLREPAPHGRESQRPESPLQAAQPPSAPAPRIDAPLRAPQQLPGQPANRLYQGGGGDARPHHMQSAPPAQRLPSTPHNAGGARGGGRSEGQRKRQ